MRKLGFDVDAVTVDSEIERKFKATFQGPMSASKQQALQILFSGEFDPAAMDLDMSELDTMEA
jgi:CheY-like chemotaxis protein